MSITNAECPCKGICEFCDTAEDIYSYYISDENKGRMPGLIDETN